MVQQNPKNRSDPNWRNPQGLNYAKLAEKELSTLHGVNGHTNSMNQMIEKSEL